MKFRGTFCADKQLLLSVDRSATAILKVTLQEKIAVESKLYVGNLSYDSTEQTLRELFSQAGEVKEIALITDKYTGQPKGFGFVQMMSQADAEKAIRMFNDQEFDGRRLIVNIARPKEERSGSGGYRRHSGSRGGGRGRY